MSTSNSRLTYQDCYDVLDKALDDPIGVRVKVATDGDAANFRVRLHTARRIDREENATMYGPDHPMYGKSVYDPLVIKIRPIRGQWYVYIEHRSNSIGEVEGLSEAPEIRSEG